MDDYKELIERLRFGNTDSETMNGAANAIESMLAENERLKHNLTTTEQTMREYQELAAKRLEEIAKYRDAPVVAWCHYDYAEKTADYLQHFKDTYASIPLIVKPGENQ